MFRVLKFNLLDIVVRNSISTMLNIFGIAKKNVGKKFEFVKTAFDAFCIRMPTFGRFDMRHDTSLFILRQKLFFAGIFSFSCDVKRDRCIFCIWNGLRQNGLFLRISTFILIYLANGTERVHESRLRSMQIDFI